MSFLRRLGEGIGLLEQKGLFVAAFKKSLGEAPTITFQTLRDYYLKDPSVSAAVDYMAEQAVGSGFFTTAKDENAKLEVDRFAEDVGLDQVLIQVTKEVVYAGNSFVEKVGPQALEALKVLPLTSIVHVRRDEFGRLDPERAYEQRLAGNAVFLKPDEVLHFKFNIVDGSAFGTGLLNPLAETFDIDERNRRPALLAVKAQLETSFNRIMKRYAAPKVIWNLEGATDTEIEKAKKEIQEAPEDVDFVAGGRIKATATPVVVDPRARFEAYFQYLESQILAGLQTPVIKLFQAPGFTEASATVAKEISQRKIELLQRYLKRVVEREIFTPILQQKGFDPKKAEVRLNWGTIEKPEPKLQDIVTLAQISAQTGTQYLKPTEVRAILRKLGWQLEEDIQGDAVAT